MDSAREAVGWLERHATYTRTGHHSARTGEWRDGDGLVASLFLHHLSRDGDPQLHVHVAIWNRVQRADGADGKWRTLDSRTLHNQRLGVAPVADRGMETRLTALGYAMVPRADGNGAEVGGVSQDVMDLFSSRAVAVTGELKRLAQEYEDKHGKPPSRRTLWLLHQQAGQNTRRTKSAGPPHHRRADRHRRTHRGAAARRLGSTDRAAGSARTVRGARAGRARSPPGAPRVHRPCWMMRPSAPPRGSQWPRCNATTRSGRWRSSGSRCTGRCPVLQPGADGEAVVTEVARLAVCGRAGTEVIQVTAPDITDVTSLGVRASDGGSIYRPPHEERYCTLAHLDTEEQILAAAKRTVPQLVSHEQARAAAERTGLNGEQRDAVVDDAHRGRGHDGADRPGRGGQEPHDGRVRPAVDHRSPAGGSSA